MRCVRRAQTHVHARAHAERLRALGGSRSEVVYLAKKEGAIVGVDSCPFGPFARRGFPAGLRAAPPGAVASPRHALRIGFLPNMRHPISPWWDAADQRATPVAGYFSSTPAGYRRAVHDGSD
jgi:hypothetical protein